MPSMRWLWLYLLTAVPAFAADEDALPEGAKMRLGTNRLRHGGIVQTVALSADGKRLASAAQTDRVVRIWDVETGRRIAETETLPTVPTTMRFSPDGKWLAGGDYYSEARVWDAATGKNRWLSRQNGGTCLAWSSDGKLLAVGGRDGRIRLWDTSAGTLTRTITGMQFGNVLAVGFSSADSEVVALGHDAVLRRWETKTGNLVRQFNVTRDEYWGNRSASQFAFAPDGQSLVAVNNQGGMYLWGAAKEGSPRIFKTTPGGAMIASVCFSGDGRFIATGNGPGSLSVWGVASGRELRTFPGMPRHIPSLAVSADARLVAVGSGPVVMLLNTADGKPVHQDNLALASLRSMLFLDGGNKLATLHEDGGLSAWDAATGKHLERLSDRVDIAGGLAVVASGRAVRALAVSQGWIDWVPGGRREVRSWLGEWMKPLSPDGRTFIRLERGVGQLHDAESDRALAPLVDSPTASPIISWSPDGKRFAARGGTDALIRLWDVGLGRVIASFPPAPIGPQWHQPAYLSPGGRMLAQYVGELRIWETASGGDRLRLSTQGRTVSTAIFSRDGRVLVAGTSSGELLAYDLDTGKEVLRRAGHRGPVRCLRFSPDESLLASGGDDTTVLLWDAAPLRIARSVHKATPEEAASWWDELASKDVGKAYAVVKAMGNAAAEAVSILKLKLEPIREDSGKRIGQLIADLEARRFSVRERAMRELAEIGSDAEKPLEQALASGPSLDAKRRIEELLKQVKGRPQEGRVRALRAVEVLDRAGTPEALALLKALAGGAPDAWLTREAKGVLDRR